MAVAGGYAAPVSGTRSGGGSGGRAGMLRPHAVRWQQLCGHGGAHCSMLCGGAGAAMQSRCSTPQRASVAAWLRLMGSRIETGSREYFLF
jgi:hypothetical protein